MLLGNLLGRLGFGGRLGQGGIIGRGHILGGWLGWLDGFGRLWLLDFWRWRRLGRRGFGGLLIFGVLDAGVGNRADLNNIDGNGPPWRRG